MDAHKFRLPTPVLWSPVLTPLFLISAGRLRFAKSKKAVDALH